MQSALSFVVFVIPNVAILLCRRSHVTDSGGSTLADRWIKRPVLVLILVFSAFAIAQQGKVEQLVVHSHALEGNVLGDSADRNVTVYLPPGYAAHPAMRYPTLYLLHGLTANNSMWFGGGYITGLNIASIADGLIASGTIRPMILVMPDASNIYGGSYYTNSSVSGNWDDFVAEELVTYVDAHFRTLARPESRAVVGHSMGGFGALKLAMEHPDVYSVAYAMSPSYAGFVDIDTSPHLSSSAFVTTLFELSMGSMYATIDEIHHIAMAAAFSPDPNSPPYFIDLPFQSGNNQVGQYPKKPAHKVDAIWKLWKAHTPLGLMDRYGMNLLLDRGVGLDIGTSDDTDYIDGARAFADALTQAGIPHTYTEYAGHHSDKVAARLRSVVLPFVSRNLKGATAYTAGL